MRTPDLVRLLKDGKFPDSELEVYKQRSLDLADATRADIATEEALLTSLTVQANELRGSVRRADGILRRMTEIQGGDDGTPLGRVKQGEFSETDMTALIGRVVAYRTQLEEQAGLTERAMSAARLEIRRLEDLRDRYKTLAVRFEEFKDEPDYGEGPGPGAESAAV